MTNPPLGATTWADAKTRVDQRRATGGKIVLTNGVFDLIHPGHLRGLWHARSLGDFLVVAINSDASVRRLKGDKRPVIADHERAKILSALEPVDCVVIFEQDTPLEIINLLQPDILAKGGDYVASEVVGASVVEARGGKVELLPFIDGYSTTRVVERIVSAQQPQPN